MNRCEDNEKQQLDTTCLEPNEQAVEIVLFIFYYWLERLFNMQMYFFQELPQYDLRSPCLSLCWKLPFLSCCILEEPEP